DTFGQKRVGQSAATPILILKFSSEYFSPLPERLIFAGELLYQQRPLRRMSLARTFSSAKDHVCRSTWLPVFTRTRSESWHIACVESAGKELALICASQD